MRSVRILPVIGGLGWTIVKKSYDKKTYNEYTKLN